jgi:hypothetical protein
MKFNTINTDSEYMAQGFSKEEIPLIREHDRLFNLYILGCATEEESERMFYLVRELGL